MPMWTWWSLLSFADKTNSDPPSCQSRLLCDLLLTMRAAWCSSRNHTAQKQDEQLPSCTIRNTEHRPSCQVALRFKPFVNVKVIRVYRTTTQCKDSIDHDWDLFANNGRTTIMWFQASESAPRTHHGGMRFSTRTHNATTRRTIAQLHTQDNWTTCHPANQVFGGNVLQMWRPMVCITRPHCANIAMIVAGTSSQTMSTKLVWECPPEILAAKCSSHANTLCQI